jgi:hypothetical protein
MPSVDLELEFEQDFQEWVKAYPELVKALVQLHPDMARQVYLNAWTKGYKKGLEVAR